MSVEVRGVAVHRSGRSVLENIDVTVPPGTCLAVVGPNGSGKSTLLGAISGDLPPVAGTIRVAGEPVEQRVGQARLRAVMTQDTSVAFGFTAAEVIGMGRAPWRGTSTEERDAAAVASAVADADVSELLDRPVQSLSGGERARVAFARTLAQATPVLLLDEPTAALDLRHQVDLLDTVRRRVRAGATAIVVLHDLTLAAAVADQVLVLSEGQVAALGTPAETLEPGLLASVYGVAVTVLPTEGGQVVIPSRWVEPGLPPQP